MLAGLDFTGNSAAFVEEYEGDIQSLVAMLDNRQTPSESKAQNNKKQFLKKKLCDMEVSWSKDKLNELWQKVEVPQSILDILKSNVAPLPSFK